MSTRLTIKAFLVSLLPLLGSCGYQMGSIMHPQIKSIAVAPVVNESIEPFVSAELRQALVEQFQWDGSVKVKSLKEADCIIHGRVIEVVTTDTADATFDDSQTFRAAEWSVKVVFEFEVTIPGREKPLVQKRIVEGKATYQILTDQQTTRRRGIQQACRNAAVEAVIYTVEAW